MTSRNKPTAGFWITLALVAVLVGYPLSFGPACWITLDGWIGHHRLKSVYRPIARAATRGPAWRTAPLLWYASRFGDERETYWFLKAWSTREINGLPIF